MPTSYSGSRKARSFFKARSASWAPPRSARSMVRLKASSSTMAPPSFRPGAVKRNFNPGREPTHEPTQLDRWHRHRCHLDADRLGTGANAESSAAAGRSSARRECRDADPERAAAQGVSREDVEED